MPNSLGRSVVASQGAAFLADFRVAASQVGFQAAAFPLGLAGFQEEDFRVASPARFQAAAFLAAFREGPAGFLEAVFLVASLERSQGAAFLVGFPAGLLGSPEGASLELAVFRLGFRGAAFLAHFRGRLAVCKGEVFLVASRAVFPAGSQGHSAVAFQAPVFQVVFLLGFQVLFLDFPALIPSAPAVRIST